MHKYENGWISSVMRRQDRLERQKEKKRIFRRNYYNKGARAMYKNITFNEAIETALVTAAKKAQSVCSRSYIVADYKIAIGEFVTSLRRELSTVTHHHGMKDRQFTTRLCDKDSWDDILVLSTLGQTRLDQDQKSLVSCARVSVNRVDTAEHIDFALNAVNSKIDSFSSIIKDMQAINKEADDVLNGFKDLAKEMQE